MRRRSGALVMFVLLGGCRAGSTPEPAGTSIMVPYVVAYVYYEPPGDASAVDYPTLGSNETMTIKTTTGESAHVKLAKDRGGGPIVTYANSDTKADSFSTTMLAETTQFAAQEDQPDHAFDQYVINFNVRGTVTAPENGQPPTIALDMSSGTQVQGILAAFLQEIADSQPLTIDDPTVKALVTGAIDTPEKAAELLALDPFFTPSFTNEVITQNPARFVPFITDITGSNIVPLPHPIGTNLDGGVIQVGTVKYTGLTASTTGQGTGTGATVTYNGTLDLLDTLGLSESYSITNSIVDATKTTTTGDSITLGTDHLCVRGNISLYQDMMFGGSFLTLQDTLLDPACQAAIDAM